MKSVALQEDVGASKAETIYMLSFYFMYELRVTSWLF